MDQFDYVLEVRHVVLLEQEDAIRHVVVVAQGVCRVTGGDDQPGTPRGTGGVTVGDRHVVVALARLVDSLPPTSDSGPRWYRTWDC